jgi:signal transduction histidine kinase
LPAGNSSAVTSNAWPSRNSGCERDLRANTLAHAKEAFVTISALRAGDDQRSQPEKERPSFVRLAQLGPNAIEAMQFTEGRARTLRVRSATDTANGVLVMVEDSGPGIDPENLDRIFHPFFTTKPEGTGMGLSISRSIIEAHNGHLTVSPAADGGSVFQIALPAADLSSCGESGG